MCGFDMAATMSSHFRRIMGTSPALYRSSFRMAA